MKKPFVLVALVLIFSLIFGSWQPATAQEAAETTSLYFVFFEGESYASKFGSPVDADGNSILNQAYIDELADNRNQVLNQASLLLGRELEPTFIYDMVLNAVAVSLTEKEAEMLKGLPGITNVWIDVEEHIITDNTNTVIGSTGVWTGSSVPGGTPAMGENMIVGIIDSGINFDHPSFAQTSGSDGYVYPAYPTKKGVCAVAGGDYVNACNNKLIGAYSYVAEVLTPEDSNGHGTHVAATAAGNFITLNYVGTRGFSGVAKHSRIIAYDVCDAAGSCAQSASAAAVQQAIRDGVHVINFSISGGLSPYTDSVELAFLDAMNANIVVAAAAGNQVNTEPTQGAVNHVSPWLITVGASTHQLTGGERTVTTPDIMGSFSYLGPSANNYPILKPDLTAPGLSIMAAYNDGVIDNNGLAEMAISSGTSMASPNVAGAAALIRQLHPTWTAMEIKSALAMGGNPTPVKKPNGTTAADQFDMGNGRLAVSSAARIGFVLNETKANFTASNPASGGNPRTLNIASLQSNTCADICKWTRTFKSVWATPVTFGMWYAPGWLTMTPNIFTIAPGATQTVTFTANVGALNDNQWYLGSVSMMPSGAASLPDPSQIPFAIKPIPNTAPSFLTLPAFITAPEMQLITFTPTATDPDLPDQTLTWSLDTPPAGAAINPSTGVFTWTPTEEQGYGVMYNIRVRVCDNGSPNLCKNGLTSITVTEVNRPPDLYSIGLKAINETLPISFTIRATDPDIPAQSLVYSMTLGNPPATGATFDPNTRTFSWTPTEAQGGLDYFVTFRVCDNFPTPACDSEDVRITVIDTNVAPILAPIGNKSVQETQNLSFAISATDADIPAQTLTYSMTLGTPAATGATFNASTRTFSWTPTAAQGPGTYPVTFRVCDTYSTCVNETITITVTDVTNAPPVLAPIGNKSVNELAELTFNISATDPDGQPLTYSMILGSPAATGATFNPSTRAFAWTPTEAQGPGSYPVTFRVCDNFSTPGCDEEVITISVAEVNTPPIVDPVGNKTVNEGSLLAFNVVARDTDIPVQELVYDAMVEVDGHNYFMNPFNGRFEWTPIEAEGPGVYPAIITVCEATGIRDCVHQQITITVNEVNQTPVLDAIGNKTVNELQNLSFTINGSDADLPAQTLTYSMTLGSPAATGATFNATTRTFSWTPTGTQGPGIYPVTFRLCDNFNPAACDTETINITVNDTNFAPILTPIGAKTINELTNLTFALTAVDPDVPAQPLTYTMVLGNPAATGATLNGTTFSWTPTEAQGPGVYPITFRVCDNYNPPACDEELVNITVAEVNAAPVLAPIGNKTVRETTMLTFQVSGSDPDLPAQNLTFSMTLGSPAATGATFDPITRIFTWTPTAAQGPGVYPVTFRLCDSFSPQACVTENINITVTETNNPPVLSPIGNKEIFEMSATSFTIEATDPDSPPQVLTYTMTLGNPAATGAVFNPSTRTFTWTPIEVQGPGSYPVTFRVCDNFNPVACDQEVIMITVREANQNPVLDPVGDKSVFVGESVRFTARATDPDLPVQGLEFFLRFQPQGSKIDPITGQFTWTPTAEGIYVFDVGVIDEYDGTDTEAIRISVNAPILPTNSLYLPLIFTQ